MPRERRVEVPMGWRPDDNIALGGNELRDGGLTVARNRLVSGVTGGSDRARTGDL